MFNLDKFISDSVTFRPSSMFEPDIKANAETLTREIKGKKVCVIGGAGSIGSSFIKAVLRFEPKSVVVVDLNENGLAELVRDVRSTNGLYVPDEFRCYTLNFADPIFERIFREEKGFDIWRTDTTSTANHTNTLALNFLGQFFRIRLDVRLKHADRTESHTIRNEFI